MRRLPLACLTALLVFPVSLRAEDESIVAARRLLTLYQNLHSRPELSYKEFETAKVIAREWKEAGAEVTTGVGMLGVVGLLKNGDGPTVLVRTDLDGLPVVEETGIPYASKATSVDDAGKTVGVMHACGHDVHMACLVGVARWLNEHRDRWRGTVVLVGQPAEEKIGGAKAMLADGLYTRFPKPDFALALHVAADLDTGKVAYTRGPALASSTSVDIVVRGKGGHGAMPNFTVDPIVLGSALVLDLQTIVSREVNPLQPAVVTVGSFHAGSKHNIIPSEALLQLTIRSYRPEVQDQILAAIVRKANGLAAAHRAPAPTVTIGESTPPTVNTPTLVDRIVPVLKDALGAANVVEAEPTMGAEDFGLFATGNVPIFMFRLGTIPAAKVAEARARGETPPSLHSSKYYPDPLPSLATGLKAMTSAVVNLIPPR